MDFQFLPVCHFESLSIRIDTYYKRAHSTHFSSQPQEHENKNSNEFEQLQHVGQTTILRYSIYTPIIILPVQYSMILLNYISSQLASFLNSRIYIWKFVISLWMLFKL